MLGNHSQHNVTTPTSGHVTGSTCFVEPSDEETVVGLTFAYSALLLVALPGNSLIIYIVRTNKTLKRIPFNHIILNLAASDTIYALVVAPLMITYLFINVQWFSGTFGLLLCKASQFCAEASLASTILTLTVISGERYWGILHAMKSPLSLKAVRWLIYATWGMASILASPQLYVYTTYQEVDSKYYCVPSWSDDSDKHFAILRIVSVVKFVICFAIPLSTMAVLYGRMILYLWKRIPPGENNDLNRRKARSQGRRVVTMLVTVVTVFAICWFPVHVCHYLISFDFETYACLPTVIPLLLFWLAHANAAINPWLCIFFNNKFRVLCFRMTRAISRKKKSSQSPTIELKNAATNNTPLSQRKALGDNTGTPCSLRRLLPSSLKSTPQTVRQSHFLQDSPQSTPQTQRRVFHDLATIRLLACSPVPCIQPHVDGQSPPLSPLQQHENCNGPGNRSD